MQMSLVYFILGQMAFVLGFLWIVIHYRSRRQARVSEERNQLLARFDDPDQLLGFLESEAGRRYLEHTGSAPSDPRRGLAYAFGVAIFALCGGIGLFLVERIAPLGGSGLVILAALMLTGGIGILAAVTLARRQLPEGDR